MSISNITLSSSVRQNLLSLQDTANLLSTTQTRLATGKKVNSALDNPTNFFTAAGLDARASDISNLLDSIGNGVQVLQAADTGITSLSKLVDTAKSIANQVLQQPSGYSTRASLEFTGSATSPTGTFSASDLNEDVMKGAVLTFKTSTGSTAITIGSSYTALSSGTATVKTLDDLNTVLAAAGVNLTASITGTGKITFTSNNDGAGQVITKAGTAPTAADAVDISATSGASAGTVAAAVADAVSQATRASLVSQYNQIMTQITTTAQDASFNGINLLNGDTLKMVFNETGKSTSTISGVTFNPAGLGLAKLTAGTAFVDNAATNTVLSALNTA